MGGVYRRGSPHPQAGHAALLERGLRAGLRFLVDLGGKQPHPEPHHLLTLAYLVESMNAKGWRVYDQPGYPAARKVPALVALWCRRLPRWSPEDAFRALLEVQPFGGANGLRTTGRAGDRSQSFSPLRRRLWA